jgi:hypothetical protein
MHNDRQYHLKSFFCEKKKKFYSSIKFFAFIMIIIVVINRQCRTITNLMMCNSAAATVMYSILQLFSAVYGIRED